MACCSPPPRAERYPDPAIGARTAAGAATDTRPNRRCPGSRMGQRSRDNRRGRRIAAASCRAGRPAVAGLPEAGEDVGQAYVSRPDGGPRSGSWPPLDVDAVRVGARALSGGCEHVAFVPHPLPRSTPTLSVATFNRVATARAALASLDSSARQLPKPNVFRRPAWRGAAQSTSAREATFAPLEAVLAAHQDEDQPDSNPREVLNDVRAAESSFAWLADWRPPSVGLLTDLQQQLVRGTAADNQHAGRLRDIADGVPPRSRRAGRRPGIHRSRRTRGALALRMMCAFSPLPAGRCERLLTFACAPGDRAATPA